MTRKNTDSKGYAQERKVFAKDRKEFEKELRASQKEIDKEYKKIIRDAAKVGLYNPKSIALTPYRRRRAREIKNRFSDVLYSPDVQFVKAPKSAIERAKDIDLKTSKFGIFVPKAGHKKVSVGFDKKRKEYFIKKSGRTKRGPNAGRIYTSITPLVPIDKYDELDHIKEMCGKLMPLEEGERLYFTVSENGVEGMSKITFSSCDEIIKHIEKYPKQQADRVRFMRLITIHKVKSSAIYGKMWKDAHPDTDIGPTGKPRTRKIKGYRGKKG